MNKHNFVITAFALVTFLGACSTSKKFKDQEHDDIEREYLVKDSSSNYRPGWIEDAEGWAGENTFDTKTYKYYSYETTPKVGRNVACNLAKANVKADIAGEISTKINQELTTTMSGSASIDENSPAVKDLQEMVDNSLSQTIAATISGAQIKKTYWEKRAYQKDLGAKKDFKAFTCAVFVQIQKSNLNKGLSLAQKKLEKAAKGKMSREEVRRIIKNTKQDLNI